MVHLQHSEDVVCLQNMIFSSLSFVKHFKRSFYNTGLGLYGLIELFGTPLLVVFNGDVDLSTIPCNYDLFTFLKPGS